MKKRLSIVAAALVAVALTVGIAASVMAEETPPPSGDWSQQMWQWCHGGGGSAPAGAYMNPAVATQVAKALGMTTQDLLAERSGGKSVFQIAAAKGVSEQQVLDAALAPYKDTLALRVKYGYITQEQADQLLQQEEQQLRSAFSATGTTGTQGSSSGYGMGPGMMGGYGPSGGMLGGDGGRGGMMGGFGGRGMMGSWW